MGLFSKAKPAPAATAEVEPVAVDVQPEPEPSARPKTELALEEAQRAVQLEREKLKELQANREQLVEHLAKLGRELDASLDDDAAAESLAARQVVAQRRIERAGRDIEAQEVRLQEAVTAEHYASSAHHGYLSSTEYAEAQGHGLMVEEMIHHLARVAEVMATFRAAEAIAKTHAQRAKNSLRDFFESRGDSCENMPMHAEAEASQLYNQSRVIAALKTRAQSEPRDSYLQRELRRVARALEEARDFAPLTISERS